jgi:glutaredoxin
MKIQQKMPAPIRIYTQLGCVPCDATKKYFQDRGVHIEVVIVDELLKQGIARSLEVKELQTPITMCYAGEATQLVIGYSPEAFDKFIEDSKDFKIPHVL